VKGKIAKTAKGGLKATSFGIQNAWLSLWPIPAPSSKRRVFAIAPLGGFGY